MPEPNESSEPIIRVALPQDAWQLMEIYAPYVTETAITFETDVPTATAMLRRRDEIVGRYPYLVIEQDNTILGYAYAHAFNARAAYDWSAEVSIYLRMDERRKGFGGTLYRRLEEILRAQGVKNLNACIACPKEAIGDDAYLTHDSIDFHAHLGYQLVGRFHDSGYKFGRWYDMVWMEKMIGEHRTPAAPIRAFAKIRSDFGL